MIYVQKEKIMKYEDTRFLKDNNSDNLTFDKFKHKFI